VREYGGLLGRQRERANRRIVGDKPGCRLRGQPLAHVPLSGAGLGGQRGRGQGLAGQRAEQPELVADQHERRVGSGAHLVHHSPE
jgi:hypothetical protein